MTKNEIESMASIIAEVETLRAKLDASEKGYKSAQEKHQKEIEKIEERYSRRDADARRFITEIGALRQMTDNQKEWLRLSKYKNESLNSLLDMAVDGLKKALFGLECVYTSDANHVKECKHIIKMIQEERSK